MSKIKKYEIKYKNIGVFIEEYIKNHKRFSPSELVDVLKNKYPNAPSLATVNRALEALRHKYGVNKSNELFDAINKVVDENIKNADIDNHVTGFYPNAFLTVIATEPYVTDKVLNALSTDIKDTIGPNAWGFKIGPSHILVVSPSLEHQQRIQQYLLSRKKHDLSAPSASPDQKKSGTTNDTAQK